MSNLIVIRPEDYPMVPGKETWFLVHPNNAYCEFAIPAGAAAICTKNFLKKFEFGKPYSIANWDRDHGWISVQYKSAQVDEVIKMPLYIFARYFDAEAFMRRADFRSVIPVPMDGPYYIDRQ